MENENKQKRKVMLIIRDGWGYRLENENNAIINGNTPFTDKIMSQSPMMLLDAAGSAVGLPNGYQGNSEVGHMTIGSGRIMFQSLARINKAIESGEFFENQAFVNAIEHAKEHNKPLHLIGLLQTQGVHAHLNHLFALLDLCKKKDFKNVHIHVITDGRDAPVTHSLLHVKALEEKFSEIGFGSIATISGRYYAMDRDNRWERTKKAYDAIVLGSVEENHTFTNALDAITLCHANKETDEFIIPLKREDFDGIEEESSIIFFNFRTDRTRQLTKAIVEKEFDGFERKVFPVQYVGMTQFYKPMNAEVAFKDLEFKNILGQVVSDNHLKQLRISETEKYAHITFFFNGQVETPFEGEKRVLIHSPKVATYDLQPEMSVFDIANKLCEEISENDFDLVVTNLVNGDMVGHTGDVDAIKKAVESVDKALEQIVTCGLKQGFTSLIFADHGNAEDQSDAWRTSHTINKVPFLVVSEDEKLASCKLEEEGGLEDIAPTALTILGLSIPEEMTGKCLIKNE